MSCDTREGTTVQAPEKHENGKEHYLPMPTASVFDCCWCKEGESGLSIFSLGFGFP